MYSLNLSNDGRVLSACVVLEGFAYANIVEVLPEGDINDYRYISGNYVYEPAEKPVTPEVPTEFEKIEAQVVYTAMMTDTLIGG